MEVARRVTEHSAANPILYILDTNVLIHDPTALLEFEEHHVVIPMTVLEELDKLKSGRNALAADCRQAIRDHPYIPRFRNPGARARVSLAVTLRLSCRRSAPATR